MQLIDGRPSSPPPTSSGFLACDHRLALERAALAGLVGQADPQRPVDRARRQARHRARAPLPRGPPRRGLPDRRDREGRVGRRAPGRTGEAPPRDAGAELRGRRGADAPRRCTAARTSSTRPRSSTGRGAVTRTSCSACDHEPGEPDSALGAWHYEVADTKLARHVKASAILQICSYVEQLTRDPGLPSRSASTSSSAAASGRPTASGSTTSWRTTGGSRRTSRRRSGCAARRRRPPTRRSRTYPEPVEHCDVCRWVVRLQGAAARATTT